MRGGVVQVYMTIGAIFGVILAAPHLYANLFGQGLPTDTGETKQLLLVILLDVLQGVLRAFAWLPSLIYHVGIDRKSVV